MRATASVSCFISLFLLLLKISIDCVTFFGRGVERRCAFDAPLFFFVNSSSCSSSAFPLTHPNHSFLSFWSREVERNTRHSCNRNTIIIISSTFSLSLSLRSYLFVPNHFILVWFFFKEENRSLNVSYTQKGVRVLPSPFFEVRVYIRGKCISSK